MITIWLSCTAICFACQPVRTIEMESTANEPVEIHWKMNEDSLSGNPFYLHSSSDLKFVLQPPHQKIKMSFGAGNWSPKEVQKLVNYLESFQIKSALQELKMDSLPQLRDYLLARRRGIGGARIHIVVAK